MGWTNTRARLASELRRDPDANVTDLRRQLKAERLEDHIERALADAPEISDEERMRIARLLLRGGPDEAA